MSPKSKTIILSIVLFLIEVLFLIHPTEVSLRKNAVSLEARRARNGISEVNVASLKPTGLLLRGILTIEEEEYIKIRKEGLQPKDEGGVSKSTANYAPDKVSLSLCIDGVFSASSLKRYGPLKNPANIAFIIDPEYTRTHSGEFTLVGGNFYSLLVLLYDRESYIQGLESLGLDRHKVNRYRAAIGDEIESTSIPPDAVVGIIAHPVMVSKILEWDIKNGFKHLPIYALDDTGVKMTNEIPPYEP